VRIAPDRVKAELKNAGYQLAQEYASLPKQYFLVLRYINVLIPKLPRIDKHQDRSFRHECTNRNGR